MNDEVGVAASAAAVASCNKMPSRLSQPLVRLNSSHQQFKRETNSQFENGRSLVVWFRIWEKRLRNVSAFQLFSQSKSYEKREGKIVATFLVIDKTNSRLCAVLLEEEEERPELWECRPLLLLLLLPSFIFEYKTQRKSKSKNRTQTGRNTRVGRLLHPLWCKKERKEVWRWHATFE